MTKAFSDYAFDEEIGILAIQFSYVWRNVRTHDFALINIDTNPLQS